MSARNRDWIVRHGAKILMLISIAVVGTLIVRGPPPVLVLGYAEVVPVRLASLETAKVAKTLVEPGQVLAQGEVVAQLDPTLIEGRIAILEAELQRHGAALIADEDLAKSSVLTAEAEKQESVARLNGARKALELADGTLVERKRQVDAGLASADSLAALEVEAAKLRADVDRYDRQLQHRSAVLAEARARLRTAENEPARALLEGTRAENVTREELALLQTRLDALTLRSVTASRVAALHYRVGEVVPQGAAVAELMPLETTTVIACLPERYPVEVKAGTSASLRGTTGSGIKSGTVVDVVGLISEAPERCKQRPNETGWVRPVRILVDGGGLVPGERFDVAFGAAKDTPASTRNPEAS